MDFGSLKVCRILIKGDMTIRLQTKKTLTQMTKNAMDFLRILIPSSTRSGIKIRISTSNRTGMKRPNSEEVRGKETSRDNLISLPLLIRLDNLIQT
jgi:hypothetical protein